MEFLTSFPEVGPYTYVSDLTSGVLKGAWKAYNKETKDFYAIKSISKTAFTCPEDHTKFVGEVTSLRQVNNRYIAAVLDFIDDPSTYHVVLQLPEGECLRDHIQNHGPVSDKIVKEIVARLQYVLLYLANDIGMKYSILNPDNIFVDDRGNLTSFVIQNEDPILSPTIDITDTCFLPPELISRNIRHKHSNSWSMGTIVYYALTGKIPFFGEKKETIVQSILTAHLNIPAAIPEDAKVFLQRTLTKNQLMRLPLDDIFSTQFMIGIASEAPTANERRNSEVTQLHTRSSSFLSLAAKPTSSTSLSGLVEHPQHVVHLSYRNGIKHSNSKNKLAGANFG